MSSRTRLFVFPVVMAVGLVVFLARLWVLQVADNHTYASMHGSRRLAVHRAISRPHVRKFTFDHVKSRLRSFLKGRFNL